jgi:hypothetical protein
MTVEEMIQILSEMDPTAEVRLAIQPGYPFQHTVGEIVEVDLSEDDDDEWDEEDEEDGEEPEEEKEPEVVVYIGEAGQLYSAPYLPGVVSRELGWR